jgi:quercetin dioxygenase-like cupin family protein
MTEQEYIEKLKEEGYNKVYVWDAVPNEEDLEHSHPYNTKLVVLAGDIAITVNNQTLKLKVPDTIQIPKDILHSAIAGPEGCKYIVAEQN